MFNDFYIEHRKKNTNNNNTKPRHFRKFHFVSRHVQCIAINNEFISFHKSIPTDWTGACVRSAFN